VCTQAELSHKYWLLVSRSAVGVARASQDLDSPRSNFGTHSQSNATSPQYQMVHSRRREEAIQIFAQVTKLVKERDYYTKFFMIAPLRTFLQPVLAEREIEAG
jgi:hypothetical protein